MFVYDGGVTVGMIPRGSGKTWMNMGKGVRIIVLSNLINLLEKKGYEVDYYDTHKMLIVSTDYAHIQIQLGQRINIAEVIRQVERQLIILGEQEMTRLEKLITIKGMEETKVNFENVLHDINSQYCDGVALIVQLDTKQFHSSRKYEGEQIVINEGLFREYITHEIQVLEDRINVLISGL